MSKSIKYPDGLNIEVEVEEFIKSVNPQGLTEKGNEYVLRYCPFCNGGDHKDKDTFSINKKTGQYKCQRGSCGEEGNLYSLSKDWRIPYEMPEPETEKREIRKHIKTFSVSTEHDERAAEWIEENRGIPKEVTYRYKVAFGTDKFKKILNREGNMICAKPSDKLVWQFTNANGNKTLWYKFRRTDGVKKSKEWAISNEFSIDGIRYTVEPCLFGMGECDYKTSEVILTEGQFDTLAISAAGFGNVVSVPLGIDNFKWYDENAESRNFLSRFDTLTVFGDCENGKISLIDAMKERFRGKIKCVRVEDYKGCKDANDVLRKHGVEQIRKCIENAEEIEIQNLKRMKDIKRVNMSELPRISTGIKTLDHYLLGFFYGQVITLTGRSGDGKSTLASQFVAFALHQHVPTVIYSGELPEWMVKEWLVFQLAGPANVITSQNGNDIKKEAYDKIEDWAPFGEECYVYTVDDLDINENEDDGLSMLATIKEAILRAGVRFIVIDNMMTAMSFSEDGDLNKLQSAFMKQLKFIAKMYDVIILLVAHPKKAPTRGTLDISKEDIAGSSNIGNLSDTIISYSRPTSEGADYQREIKILKNRWNNDNGVGGVTINTYFNGSSKRIAESKTFEFGFEWEQEFRESIEDYDEIPF